MRSTSRICARRANIQITKTTPVTNTITTGESPTAFRIATMITIAIAFVVSLPFPEVITPPPFYSLLLFQPRNDGAARLLCRKFAAEIPRGLVGRDCAAHSLFDLVAQFLEAQVF